MDLSPSQIRLFNIVSLSLAATVIVVALLHHCWWLWQYEKNLAARGVLLVSRSDQRRHRSGRTRNVQGNEHINNSSVAEKRDEKPSLLDSVVLTLTSNTSLSMSSSEMQPEAIETNNSRLTGTDNDCIDAAESTESDLEEGYTRYYAKTASQTAAAWKQEADMAMRMPRTSPVAATKARAPYKAPGVMATAVKHHASTHTGADDLADAILSDIFGEDPPVRHNGHDETTSSFHNDDNDDELLQTPEAFILNDLLASERESSRNYHAKTIPKYKIPLASIAEDESTSTSIREAKSGDEGSRIGITPLSL